jgi:hypothetical protein
VQTYVRKVATLVKATAVKQKGTDLKGQAYTNLMVIDKRM